MSKAANVPSVVTSTVVVALVLLLCSCGGKEPVQFGNLELSGKTIEDSAPSSGVAPPKDWPQACSLIAKSEVRSLLPNSKVSLVGKRVEVLKGRGVDYTVPGGQCQVESHQPGGRSNYSDVVWIDVMAWGGAERSPGPGSHHRQLVQQGSGQQPRSAAVCRVGRCERFVDAPVRCFQGPLAFDVRGAVGAKTEIAGATSDSYEVLLWYDNVVKPVARAVAAHVPI